MNWVNDLVRYGAGQCVVNLQESFLSKYSLHFPNQMLREETFKHYRNSIAQSGDVPFVRAAGSKQVVLSAGNWTLGMNSSSSPEL